ncbi:MAG TPA: caspase family protein [Kofleriaceae bacterium]|nr:caspase family protein [Kofleriaceae bacterium]
MQKTLLLGTACALAIPRVAHAGTDPDPQINTYALVVGSNAPGPGQQALRYAEDDARRVGQILTELGGYTPATVDIVVHPTPDSLRDHIAKLGQKIATDQAAGKQTRLFFYYSGHARATAIDLGPAALPLAELRQRLFAIPATLTVVVLDACQSGAFSRVKGASPAADFSFNSRQHLDATGVAVLASSSGSELSQESEQLRSSYFTHHLLVGMRGAGDANGDGQVSVDEAYRYAYHQTLLATATTAVGGQHVSLEVDLKGHGEVPLSFPRAATAAIEFPATLEGEALVRDKRANAVVAETHKAKGAAVRIAVAPGDYEVVVRQGNRLLRCQLVAPGVLDASRCTNEAFVDSTRKGQLFVPNWRFAVDLTLGNERDDAFVQTLRDFGYREDRSLSSAWSASVFRNTERYGISAGGFARYVGGPAWSRDTELSPLRFEWWTAAFGPALHLEKRVTRRLSTHADVDAGLAISRTHFVDQDDKASRDTFFGPSATLGAGFAFRGIWLDELAFTFDVRGTWQPVIENDIGDTHDSGGIFYGFGLSYTRGERR